MYYKLWISETSAFTSLVVNQKVKNVSEYVLTSNQALKAFTVYWWKVKAVDEETGNSSKWSTPCWFRVIASDVTTSATSASSIVYTPYSHRFVRSYDYDCITPNARIGYNTSGIAQIGVVLGSSACTGVPLCDVERVNPFSEGFTYYFQYINSIPFVPGTHEIEIEI